MLMDIGMNRRRVLKMIMLETILLTAVGAVTNHCWLGQYSTLGRTGIHLDGWGKI
jgi:hypothetical protein